MALHLPSGPFKKTAVGMSQYRYANPIPTSPLADDTTTVVGYLACTFPYTVHSPPHSSTQSNTVTTADADLDLRPCVKYLQLSGPGTQRRARCNTPVNQDRSVCNVTDSTHQSIVQYSSHQVFVKIDHPL